jgi:hypothetical protein
VDSEHEHRQSTDKIGAISARAPSGCAGRGHPEAGQAIAAGSSLHFID